MEKIEIKGINYRLNEETLTAEVEVINKEYEGDIIIPETVVFQEVAYRVTSIGEKAFTECSSLTSIVIPDGVTSIGRMAFYNCSSLTSIVIPASVTSIGDLAFSGCTSLTSVVVAEGNTVYDSREQCNAIIHTATNTLISGCQNTIIPDGVTSIGDGTFFECKSLTSIVIPDGVTSIGEYAFEGCSSLTSIVIPDSVTSIGEEAFEGCTSLKQKPTQEKKMSNLKYRLLMHNHLAIVIGYSGRSATINIPSEINHKGVIYRVTSIGSYVFSGCESLTSVNIPNSVTEIGEWAFAHCSSLTSITFNGTKAQWKGIKLGKFWNARCPEITVHCTDGEVKI